MEVMGLKKLLTAILALCLLCTSTAVFAAEDISDPFGGFSGLAGALTGIEFDNPNGVLSRKDANGIVKSLLGDLPFENENPTNGDLASYLSAKLKSDTKKAPLNCKDAGLADAMYKKAYAKLNGAGRLYSDNGFLNPSSPLTYKYLLGSLKYFESDILQHNKITLKSGNVISVSLEGEVTSIKISNGGLSVIKVKRLSDMTIGKHSVIAPYSRNILQGDAADIYTDNDGNVVYINIPGEYFDGYNAIKDSYTLFKADIYYIDEQTAIMRNTKVFDGSAYEPDGDGYREFKIDGSTMFRYNQTAVGADDVNYALLDKTAYLVCDKNMSVKYFSISE